MRPSFDRIRLDRDRILTGSVVKTMFLLGWPMMLASLLQTMYNLADMLWLGRLPSAEAKTAVAAINFTGPLIFFFIAFAAGLGRGGIPIISQYIGAGMRDKANHYAAQIIALVVLISSITAVVGSIFSYQIFALMGARGDLLRVASLYASVIFLGLPFMFISQGGGAIVSAEGDTVTPLIINGVSVGINIVLDPIMIFGYFGIPSMGVIGAAVATVIARSIAAAWLIYLLFGGKLRLKPKLKDLKIKWESAKFILKVGIPSAIGISTAAFGFVVMLVIIAKLPDQELVVASYGVGDRIVNIMFVIVNGLASSMSIMLGQALGADNVKRAKKVACTGILFMFYLLLVSSGIIYLFRDPIVRFFIPNNPDVIDGAKNFLAVVLIGIPYFGIFRSVSSLLNGSGHTFQGMLLAMSRLWLIRIPLAYIMAISLGYGADGIWFAMAISNMISAGIAGILYFKGDWKKKIIRKEISQKIPKSAF